MPRSIAAYALVMLAWAFPAEAETVGNVVDNTGRPLMGVTVEPDDLAGRIYLLILAEVDVVPEKTDAEIGSAFRIGSHGRHPPVNVVQVGEAQRREEILMRKGIMDLGAGLALQVGEQGGIVIGGIGSVGEHPARLQDGIPLAAGRGHHQGDDRAAALAMGRCHDQADKPWQP
jgi:hypothetical protein